MFVLSDFIGHGLRRLCVSLDVEFERVLFVEVSKDTGLFFFCRVPTL